MSSSGGVDVDYLYGIGRALAVRAAQGDAFSRDVHGSMLAQGEAADLAIGASYDEWGKPLPTSTLQPLIDEVLGLVAGSSPDQRPAFGYRGETTVDGLVNLRARDYAPNLGTFTTVDPLRGIPGEVAVANPYPYAANDPLDKVDPRGLKPVVDHDLDLYNIRLARNVAELRLVYLKEALDNAHAARLQLKYIANLQLEAARAARSDGSISARDVVDSFQDLMGPLRYEPFFIGVSLASDEFASIASSIHANGVLIGLGMLNPAYGMVAGSDALNRAIRAGDWAAAERALVQIGASALATIATATGLLGATESLIARFGAEEGAIIAEAELATPSVQSAKLQNIVDDLYKGTTNPGRVGTGTTADAIRYELETGEDVFGRSHIQKGEDYLRALENWLKSNPDAPYHDRLVARSLADDLLDALGRSR